MEKKIEHPNNSDFLPVAARGLTVPEDEEIHPILADLKHLNVFLLPPHPPFLRTINVETSGVITA